MSKTSDAHLAARHRYSQRHKDEIKEYNHRYHLQYPAKKSDASAREVRALHDKMLAAYGGKCACCGETDPRFLTLDHVNNDGAEDRKKNGKSGSLWRRLRDLGWPQEGYQLLCWNCNCGKHSNGGVCPHKDPLPGPKP